MSTLATRVTRLEKSNSRDQLEPRNDNLSMLLGQLIVLQTPEYRLVTEEDTDPVTLAGIRAQVAWADGDIKRAIALEAWQQEHRRPLWNNLSISEQLERVLDLESPESKAEAQAVANVRRRLGTITPPTTPTFRSMSGR